jgi:oligopeptide/dipeptide ABC transporter ATP-binding protein
MRQRVMIAMAMANDPRLLIADEATTALDVTVQAQVLDVLREAQARTGAAMLMITHDLGVVAAIADRVVVMYAGRVVEDGAVDDVLNAPNHPYTKALLSAVPRLEGGIDGRLAAIPGAPPSPGDWPTGCVFHPRCAHATERCTAEQPLLELVLTASSATHDVACHHPQ